MANKYQIIGPLIPGSGVTPEQIGQIETNKNNIERLSEDIAELKENGTGTGGGLNTTSKALLRQLLEATVYDSDVLPQPQTVIDAFFNSLGGGSDEPVEPDVPDVPVEPDEPDEPVVTYTITNNLTNCTNSNSLTSIEKGSSYTAVISANEGYELETVTVTHGGKSVTVTGGTFTISSVSGDIIIVANAKEKEEENSGILYQVTERQYANTDTPETTGLSFGSTDAFGYKKAWTITLSFEPEIAKQRMYMLGADGVGEGGRYFKWLIELDGVIPFLQLHYFNYRYSFYNNLTAGNTYKIIMTHDAESDKDVTVYFVDNGNVLGSQVLSVATHGMSHGNYLLDVIFGGIRKENITNSLYENFTGTIHDFTIYDGKCFTAEEAKAYLVV